MKLEVGQSMTELEEKVNTLEKALADANKKIGGLQEGLKILMNMIVQNLVDEEGDEFEGPGGPEGPSMGDFNN